MTGAASELTLQILGTIEGLLFLKEEGVADKRQPANGLAVRSVRQTVSSAAGGNCIVSIRKNSRIRPWMTFIVGEIFRIVSFLASRAYTGDLSRDVCGAFVDALIELVFIAPWTTCCTGNGLSCSS